MRGRLAFILAAIVIAGGFAALNWSEMTRTTPLSFGLAVTEAPLGLVLLFMLGVALLVFLVSAATQETRHQIEYGRHQRILHQQRELAEKAEASRFTDLRQQLDNHLRDSRRRDEIVASEVSKAMVESQRDLRAHLDTTNQALLAQIRELEARIDARLDRLHALPAEARAEPPTLRDRVKL